MELMVVRVWVRKQLLLRVDWAVLNLPSPKNWWLYFKDEPGLGANLVPLTTQLLRHLNACFLFYKGCQLKPV